MSRMVLLSSVLLLACGTSKETIKEIGNTDGGTDSGGMTGSDGGMTANDPENTSLKCSHEKAKDFWDTGHHKGFQSLDYTVPQQDGCPAGSAVGQTFSFSCTMCPGGDGELKVQGKYKYYEGDDVTAPSPDDWRETLEVKGNRFWNHMKGVDIDGVTKEVWASGFYFCPHPEEAGGIKYNDYWNTIWVYETVEADVPGAFGITVGAADLTFMGIGLAGKSDDVLLDLNLCWDVGGSSQGQNQYCKIGSTLQGRECRDPFGSDE